MTLKFLGQEFETVDALRAVYPAFSGQGPVRAIRAGADTPLAVEQYCWKRNSESMARSMKGVRARTQMLKEKAARARKVNGTKSRKAAA